ncbi:MAG: hypothetical protein KJO28_00345 [Desulfofustis sp.]|nr:hypothetical protein [Desulfofustis sp.]
MKEVLVLICTAIAILLASCSTKQPLPTEEEKQVARMKVPCIIALPVITDLRSNKGAGDQIPSTRAEGSLAMEREHKETIKMIDSTGFPVMAGPTSDDALTYQNAAKLEKGAEFLDTQLKNALRGHDTVRFLSNRQLTSLLPENEMTQAALLRSIYTELKCNAVLVTSLSRYTQRVGGDYGVDSPASVAFSMKLFDAADGSVIWSATFDETQQSFMSNIMSAHKYGLKWLTAEDLATLGIEEKIAQCPYL